MMHRHTMRAIGPVLSILAAGCATPERLTPTPEAPQEELAASLPSASATPGTDPTATASEACMSSGHVEAAAYESALLDEQVPFRIYLPPCSADGGPYPTVYALHGKPFDESHWDDLGFDEAVDAGIARGDWPPLIIVMPRVPEPLFSSTDGGPGSYEQELLEGLIPSIEGLYPASHDSRVLAGISRGGVWALEIGLRHPEVFNAVAALSPALAVNRPRPEYDPLHLAGGPGPFPARFFLAAGESDWARALTEALALSLQGGGAPSELLVAPGGHEPLVWRAAFLPMLEMITAGWDTIR